MPLRGGIAGASISCPMRGLASRSKIIEVPLDSSARSPQKTDSGVQQSSLFIYQGVVLVHSGLRADPMRRISYNGAMLLQLSTLQTTSQKCVVHCRKRVRAKHPSIGQLQGCRVALSRSRVLQRLILAASR